jgi:hypothetical protein
MITTLERYPYVKPLGNANVALATECKSDDPVLVILISRACKTILFIASDCSCNYTESLNVCLYKYFRAVFVECVLLYFTYKTAMLLPVQICLACAAPDQRTVLMFSNCKPTPSFSLDWLWLQMCINIILILIEMLFISPVRCLLI